MAVITTVANVIDVEIEQINTVVADDCSEWWHYGGVDPTDCVAAYQPLYAASYAASKINLANPGLHNATDGAHIPSWTGSTGWECDGVNQYLETDIIPDSGWTLIVRFSDSILDGYCWLCGCDSTNNARFYLASAYTSGDIYQRTYGSGGYAARGDSIWSGVLAVAGQQPYLNGVADGSTLTSWDDTQSNPILIGCMNSTVGTPLYFYHGNICSMAIYNVILTQPQLQAIGAAMPGKPLLSCTRVNTTLSGQNAMILVPNNYNATLGAPLIIYHHGVSENETSLLYRLDTHKATCVPALLEAGYILAGSNAHGNNWGNDASLADYENLYAYCNANYNITRVCAWSQSMGGISGLISEVGGVIPYKGWLGTYPAANLAWCYANGFSGQIDAAYDIPGGGNYATQTAGHDPVLRDADDYIGQRMRFYASPDDATVTKADNTDEMDTLVTGHATEHDVVVCSGGHGDASHFQPDDYVDFFDRCT